MLDFVHYAMEGGFWRFAGCFLILVVGVQGVCGLILALIRGFK